ncbi:hypothetical protein FAI41_03355 [Acetobacteraceae bacterium]|nr:hypothetical protein FAI41_03355 [Acetobacteraceae bacterium]
MKIISSFSFHFLEEKILSFLKIYRFSFLFAAFYALLATWGNHLHEDDVIRASFSGISWFPDGRPLANVIYAFFSFSHNSFYHSYNARFPDLWPLTSLFSAFQMIISAGLLVNFCLKKETYPSFRQALVLLPLLSPFFLENISFHFDSLFFGSAALFSCLASVVLWSSITKQQSFNFKNYFFPILAALPFLLACLMTYQAAINIYLGFALFAGCYCLTFEKIPLITVIKYLSMSAVGFIIASLIYKAVIPIKGEWVSSHTVFATPLNLYATLCNNIIMFQKMLFRVLGTPLYFSLKFLLLSSFFISLFYILFSKSKYFTKLFASLCLLTLPLITLGGLMLALEKPIPAPRVFFGTDFTFLFSALFLCKITERCPLSGPSSHDRILTYALSSLLLFPCYIGATEWNHALIADQKIALITALRLQPDLEKASLLYPNAKLATDGPAKNALESQYDATFNPILSEWGASSILNSHFGLYFLANNEIWSLEKILLPWERLPNEKDYIPKKHYKLLAHTKNYDLHGNEELIWIKFK